MKIKKVNDIYKINILEYCFNVSNVLKEIKHYNQNISDNKPKMSIDNVDPC